MNNNRKTICLLLEGVSGLYYSPLWPGVVDCAKEHDCNVICYAGGALRMSPQNPYEAQRNEIYDHINTAEIDGVIISGTLKNFIDDAEFAEFMERFNGIPSVSLTPALDHIPSVLVDNMSGMKSLISHLACDHDYRNFAFIGGPKGNLDADQRLELFRRFVGENGLECNDSLIVNGDFTRSGGYKAALELLSKGIEFDALITANDEMALGAVDALHDNDVRVPEDTAVTGFDCIEESELTTPPLTTVRQPLHEIGRAAVELLVARMMGSQIPPRTVLSTPLVVRQSCGCFINPKHALDRRTRTLNIFMPSNNIDRLKEQLTETLYSFVSLEMSAELESGDLKDLAHGFFDEIANEKTGVFLPALNTIVRAAMLAGEDVLQWQKILAVLRRFTAGLDDVARESADNLLHESYNLFGEAAARLQAHKRLREEQKAALMRTAGHSIANSFDISGLSQAAAQALPMLGIDNFHLSLYDKSTTDFLNSRSIVTLQDAALKPTAPDTFFPTKELIPGGIKDGEKPFQVIVQPLHFKEEQLGMAVFKDGPLEGYIYDILSEHLNGALQGALLMKTVREQAKTLEEANVELTKLREQERMHLEAIKRELEIGRTIQASFLPEAMPVMAGWDSYALFMPAREVSGDFYDAFILEDGRAAFVIADVSGKDVGAALFMSLIRSLVRAFSEQSLEGTAANPLKAIEMTNEYIVRHHHTSKGRFMYATMFFAVVDPATGVVSYINAGHNPPALLRPNGKMTRWLSPTGPAVGVGIGENLNFKEEMITLEPGQMILMYTDGVTEAKDGEGNFFTQKRLAELISQPYESLEEVKKKVGDALTAHCAGAEPYDDITMMGIYREHETKEV